MNDERFMILSMLESGKITNEEAAKLLDALDVTEETNTFKINLDKGVTKDKTTKKVNEDTTTENTNDDTNDEFTKNKSKKSFNWEATFSNFTKFKNFDNFDKLGEEINSKIEVFTENIAENANSLAEGATSFANKLLGKLDDFISTEGDFIFGPYKEKYQEIIKKIENPTSTILDFTAVNGIITIKTWQEDFIKIDAKCKHKEDISVPDDFYEVSEIDNRFVVYPKLTKNLSMHLDIMIPDEVFDEIYVNNTNNKIRLNTTKANKLVCRNKNSSIQLNGCSSDKADIFTKNSSIIIDHCRIDELEGSTTNASIKCLNSVIERGNLISSNASVLCEQLTSEVLSIITSNGTIKLYNITADDISAKTSNGKIDAHGIDTTSLVKLGLCTSNANIIALLTNSPKTYAIDANTSNGKVNLEIPDLVYKNNDFSSRSPHVIACSQDSTDPDILIKALTSNASIKIGNVAGVNVKEM